MIGDILLVSLATFFVVAFVKYFVTFNMLPTLKLTLVALLALGGAIMLRFDHGWVDVVSVWLASSAVATFVHGFHKLIHAVGDDRRVAMLRSRSRAR